MQHKKDIRAIEIELADGTMGVVTRVAAERWCNRHGIPASLAGDVLVAFCRYCETRVKPKATQHALDCQFSYFGSRITDTRKSSHLELCSDRLSLAIIDRTLELRRRAEQNSTADAPETWLPFPRDDDGGDWLEAL